MLVLVVSSRGLGQWPEVVLELGVFAAVTTSGAGAGRVLSVAGAVTSSGSGAGRVLSVAGAVTSSCAGAECV